MSFRSILVHIARDTPGRLATAVELARRFDATLIGLAAEAAPIPRFDSELGYYPSPIPEAELGQIRDDIAFCEGVFVDACRTATIRHEWQSALDLPSDAVVALARRADLSIVGQFTGNPDNSPDPGELLMRIGRPLLVLPDDKKVVECRRIVVAWKDTREARRAVVDALPLLKLAAEVRMIAVANSPSRRPGDDLADAKAHLASHGVKVEAEMRDPGDTRPEEFLIALAEANADLVVAGGYGHSRLREWVLGGMTRALLDEAKVASLLSH